MLTFRFSGADGIMAETEILTSGMVGKEVKLEFSKEWEALSKTVVFKAGSVTRDVVGVSDTAVIPAEVLAQPMRRLYVGVYGVSDDGTVTPTVRAEGPRILPGVFPSGNKSTAADLPVWAQLQLELENLKKHNASTAGIAGIKRILGNVMAIIAAQVEDDSGTPQGYRMDISGLVAENDALIAMLESSEEPVDPEVALSRISAAYTGGDVPVGTSLTALTGVVVTAHYSDGSSNVVTGYSLSGTIAAGSNTVTVSYGGKTTTFSVTGVAESGGDSGDGVTGINWLVATNNPEQDTIASYGLKEPDNGYVITTDSSHTAAGSSTLMLAWPLVGGKTYSIRISNADASNPQYYGAWISTLNKTPVKGETTAVTDTVVHTFTAWNAVAAGSYKEFTYTTKESGEYLICFVNCGNIITITAEVTA